VAAPTCTDLIDAAYQEAEINPDDEVADATQAVRGLRLLQQIYKSLFTGGTFGSTVPRLITGNYTAEEGAAVTVESGTPTVTLPSVIASLTDPLPYGEELVGTVPAGVDASNRAPRDLSVVEQASATAPSLKVYDAQAKTWVELLGLTLTSAAPFAGRWQDELTALLTERLAFKPVKPDIKMAANRARIRLAYQAPAANTPTQADYF
jgi:hypothetical protein